jgi:hypothetical protein
VVSPNQSRSIQVSNDRGKGYLPVLATASVIRVVDGVLGCDGSIISYVTALIEIQRPGDLAVACDVDVRHG